MGHAILSPSAASRWLICTKSARLEAVLPDSTSLAAAEGTLAHTLGEAMIRDALGLITDQKFKEICRGIALGCDDQDFDYREMKAYCKGYCDYVMEIYYSMYAEDTDTLIYIEEKLDLTFYIDEGFGTMDVGIVNRFRQVNIDLKFGKGVPVSASQNKQLMIYGLGFYRKEGWIFDPANIEMHIYQPRINNNSSFVMATRELLTWGRKELKPIAKIAFEGTGDYAAGDHCGFCRAKPRCRALAEYNSRLAIYDFKHPDLLTEDEVETIMQSADLLASWVKAVKDFAYGEALRGKKYKGLKLVEGRSIRKYTSESKVAKRLLSEGYKETEIYSKKLLGITAMESLIGKNIFPEMLEGLVEKPKGKPALVSIEDPREEYNSAATDFQFINQNDED